MAATAAAAGRPAKRAPTATRAALRSLLAQPDVDSGRVYYLGESLGGAVALDLALACPPAGLVLVSAFTGVRELARLHYPFMPASLVADAYPTIRRIHELRAPLLVLHGDHDDIVPLSHGQALLQAAPEPKEMHVFAGVGHNDLVADAGPQFARAISSWVRRLQQPSAAQ
ncbi:MAG: alpha/beta hydrolase [Solirubrobacteraceae bacterium]